MNTSSKKKYYNTDILSTKYEESPFTSDGRFQVPIKKSSQQLDTAGPLVVQDTLTGETQSVAEVRSTRIVDSEKFVKLFVNHLDVFFDLKPGTIKLMTALIDEISKTKNIGEDQIYLNFKSVKGYFESHDAKPPTRATYMNSLAELVEKGFVAPSINPNLFFTNPAIFFNGDRVRFVTEIRKKKKTSTQALEDAGQMTLLENKHDD